MEMEVAELEPGVIAVTLNGRLDIDGATAIDLRFNAVASGSRGVLVDMAGVTFLASIGIRTLLSGARTVRRRGGQFVLLQPNQEVTELLEVSGMLDYMPVFHGREEAMARLAGGS